MLIFLITCDAYKISVLELSHPTPNSGWELPVYQTLRDDYGTNR